MENQNNLNNYAQIYASVKQVTRVRNQMVISKLLSIGRINIGQFCAASRLYSDYCNINYFNSLKSKGVVELSNNTSYSSNLGVIADTRKRFERAMNTFNKEELSIVEWAVINDDYLKYYCRVKACEGLKDISRPKYQAYAHDVLRKALDKLVKYYANN
jgi:hypothetical protein